MSTRAKNENAIPANLTDREYGWGTRGRVKGDSSTGDGGKSWPTTPVHLDEFDPEQPETSDGQWFRNGNLI
jgi:hypothetical protein